MSTSLLSHPVPRPPAPSATSPTASPASPPGAGPLGTRGAVVPPPADLRTGRPTAPAPVPGFPPVRTGGGGRWRLLRPRRRRRRLLAAGLTMTAVLLAGSAYLGERSPAPSASAQARSPDPAPRPTVAAPPTRSATELVTAPIRITDPAALRLIAAGDRVDVLAADPEADSSGHRARLVARCARVAQPPTPGAAPRSDREQPLPESGQESGTEPIPEPGAEPTPEPVPEFEASAGGLLVLSVPRSTAARLAGAGASAQLAITLCPDDRPARPGGR